MWVTTRVSPSTTRFSSSRRPPRSFLPAGLLSTACCPGSNRPGPAAPPGGPDFCPRVLSPRPGRNRRGSPRCAPGWNAPKYIFLPGGIQPEFPAARPNWGWGNSSRGRKQGCFQPPPRESSTLRSGSAMSAKHTGWVTALERRPCENEVGPPAGAGVRGGAPTSGGKGRFERVPQLTVACPHHPAHLRRDVGRLLFVNVTHRLKTEVWIARLPTA